MLRSFPRSSLRVELLGPDGDFLHPRAFFTCSTNARFFIEEDFNVELRRADRVDEQEAVPEKAVT
jgi:hypothetical protein